MKKVVVLFIVAIGFVRAASASADPPAGEAGEAGSSVGEATTYVVQYRDSVEKVARQFGVTAEEIISANPDAVSRRPICVDEREWTLRSGMVVTTCRRIEHWFHRAGLVITIPASRTTLEAETVRLNAELVALRAERDQAREERDTLRDENGRVAEERDTLRQERDRLAAANAELAKANAAMADSNNQSARRASEARTTADANSVSRRASEIESRETTVTIMAIVCGVIIVLAIIFVWWSRRPLRHLERDRAHLEVTRQNVAKEEEDQVKRRQALEEEEQKCRLALEQEQAKQRALCDQLTRWEEDWNQRNNRQNARKREQDDRDQSLASRESVCGVQEAANARQKAELDAQKQRREAQAQELADKEHGVEALRQALAAQKARQDRTDIEQEQREADLLKGFEDLNAQRARSQAQLDARRELLEHREAEIDGKVRMFDQDIQPQLAARADREAALRGAEGAMRNREQAVTRLETDLGLRAEEIQEAKGDLERRETALHVGEGELERRQIDLANERAGFDQEMAAAREAFEREMVRVREALAAEVAAAEHLIELAGGLEKAKRTLSRAKKKEEIVQKLDEREEAVAKREEEVAAAGQALAEARRALAEAEQALEDRKANLQVWADRLADKERASGGGDDDVPTVVDGRGMAVPPPLPEPGSGSVTGINMRAQTLPRRVDSVDIEGETHYEVPGGEEPLPSAAAKPADSEGAAPHADAITCVACERSFPNRSAFDAHRPECPRAAPHTPTLAPPRGPLAARTGSRFYCTVCRRDVPMDDQDAHNAAHQAQETLGPLPPPEGG